MILLSGHSLTPARKVPMETLSLQLKERESTANMTLVDLTGINVNSWFRDDTNPGAGIVWRIKSLATAFLTNTPTIQLEHVINTLRDNILFGEITPVTITGNAKATTCTAEQAARYVLRQQNDWVLGSFGYNVSNPYKFDGETLFDALEKITASLNNACWTYDMSVYPFRLNIVPKDSTVGSELRAGRNIRTITQTVDKTSMFTRFYPIGKDDLHVDGDYVERNTNIYGVVSKTETDASIDTKEELQRWANERLDNHAEPTVTIDVEGFELADATGEPLDRLTLGRICRIPLPDYGTTIQERITGLSYPDKIHQPEVVKITLANNRDDVTKIIADAIKGGARGKAGRTSTKQGKEDHAWFEDTSEHVAMCAKGIIGTDAQGNPNWIRLSEIIVDGEGIHQQVQSVQKDLVIANTKIDQNEYRIQLEANRATAAEGELSGKIIVQADRITQEVTRASAAEGELSGRIIVNANNITAEVTRATIAEGTLSGRISVNATNITAEVTRAVTEERALMGALEVEADRAGIAVGFKDTRPIQYIYQTSRLPRPGDSSVIYYCYDTKKYYEWVSSTNSYRETTPGKYIKAGEIVTSINEAGESEAHIDANKVYIGNDKSTTVINGKCQLSDVTADYIKNKIATIATLSTQAITNSGSVHSSSVEANNIYFIGSDGQGHQTNTTLKDAIKSLQITLSGNTYTLQKKSYNDADWANVGTFSRATALTDAWSSGTLTVTASPQGETLIRTLVEGTKENEDGTAYTTGGIYYVPIKSQWESGGTTYSEATGKRIKFDASTEYTNGYTNGRNNTYVSGPTWSNGTPYTGGDNNRITFTTDAPNPVSGVSKGLDLYVVQGDWSGTTLPVYIRTGSSKGNIVAQTSVLSPWLVYNDEGTADQGTLAAGHIISLKGGDTIIASWEVPSLNLETKSITSNGTFTPSAGHNGFSSVTVSVHPTQYSMKYKGATQQGGEVTHTFTTSASGSWTLNQNYSFWR